MVTKNFEIERNVEIMFTVEVILDFESKKLCNVHGHSSFVLSEVISGMLMEQVVNLGFTFPRLKINNS